MILLILCLQTAVSKTKDCQKDPPSHRSRFFNFPMYCANIGLSHPSLCLTAWGYFSCTTGLFALSNRWPSQSWGGSGNCQNSHETLAETPPSPSPVGECAWGYFFITYHDNKTCKALPIIFNSVWKRGEDYKRQIWYKGGCGNYRTDWPESQENKGTTKSVHVYQKMTQGLSKQPKQFGFIKNLIQTNLVSFPSLVD